MARNKQIARKKRPRKALRKQPAHNLASISIGQMETNTLKSAEDSGFNFTTIPSDILLLLELYIDIRNLRLCSTFFSQLNYFMRLNKQKSLEYVREESFRSRFNPRRISLRFKNWPGLKDITILTGVHTLDLSCCKGLSDVSMLGEVHRLDLSSCDITDVSSLGGVHTLNLSYCRGIKDVSMLGGVHTLNLFSCEKIKDVSMLSRVHTLCLTNCSEITDVSMLGC